ncbi:MAG: hypothetical protein WC314_24680 [Vulcanimicrobiota bacterium]
MTPQSQSIRARIQACYHAAKEDGEYRLNTWIVSDAHFSLGRLASYHGLTKKDTIEQLILKADQELRDRLTDDQHNAYLALNLTRSDDD